MDGYSDTDDCSVGGVIFSRESVIRFRYYRYRNADGTMNVTVFYIQIYYKKAGYFQVSFQVRRPKTTKPIRATTRIFGTPRSASKQHGKKCIQNNKKGLTKGKHS